MTFERTAIPDVVIIHPKVSRSYGASTTEIEVANVHPDNEKLFVHIAKVLDECARPKLKLKKHDRQFGWFDKIAERHGHASGEVRQALKLFTEARQLYFDFGSIKGMASGSTEARLIAATS